MQDQAERQSELRKLSPSLLANIEEEPVLPGNYFSELQENLFQSSVVAIDQILELQEPASPQSEKAEKTPDKRDKGRPVITDLVEDKAIYIQWKSGKYKSTYDLAKKLGIPRKAVQLICDRERHRKRKPESKRKHDEGSE